MFQEFDGDDDSNETDVSDIELEAFLDETYEDVYEFDMFDEFDQDLYAEEWE